MSTQADTLATWVGLAAAGAATLALVTAVPTAPPPAAAAVADTVDGVATSRYPAAATHPLTASAVRLGPHRLGLRNDGGTTWATFRQGPMTPVSGDTPGLSAVLDGAPPRDVFESAAAFRAAAAHARAVTPRWLSAADRLRVRTVNWRGVRVTLVAA